MSKPHGFILEAGIVVADTFQCCHCNAHFQMRRGSGKRRGFCMNCDQVHCGEPGCCVCVPFEKKLDEYEAGKRRTLHLPEL